jgi:hypothetical protein
MYAKILNGSILETRTSLPVSTERVSNFYLLSEPERNAYGWFAVVESALPSFDSVTEKLSEPLIDVVGGVPVATRSVVPKTVSDIKIEMLERGKYVAEKAITDQYPIQEQIAALANLTTAGHRTAVINQIQSVYSSFMAFRTEVNAAATPAELKAIWNSYPALQGGN